MSQTLMAKPSFVRFNILVVDDDSTSLSIVAAMLKHWDYDVVTIKRSVEAIVTIRIHKEIDIVVTDLHMPEMNGLELQQQVNEEFKNLPVIIMSSDDRESVIMKALASGVVFYIVKPFNPVDLKNVWQYAVTSKKGKSICIERSGGFERGGSSADNLPFDDLISASSVNQQKKNKCDSKRKGAKKGKGDNEQEGETAVAAPKKAKVAWNNALHNRFLQAIGHISLEKAVPKKILEFMNVPGLTRENVASHLQKYRIFLKRVAEIGAGVSSKNFTHRSSFATAHSAMMLQEAQEYAQIREKQKQMMIPSPLSSGYGGGISGLNGSIIGSLGFPSLGASSNNSESQPGLFGDQTNFHQSLFGNTTNPLYQANPGTTFGTGPNDMGANSLSFGGLSGVLMNDTNSNQMNLALGWNRSSTSGLENIGTTNNSPFSYYAGIRLNDNGELVAAGPTSLNGNDLNGGYGLINGTAGLMGNETFQHLVPGEFSSSAGFADANEPENTPVLPPLSSQQQHGLGNNAPNDFTNFGLMNNDNAAVIGNTDQPEQFGEGIDFASLLFDPSDYQLLFQQQGGEGALMSNFASGSGTHQGQLNLPINQSQNPDLSVAFAVGDNASNPWNEPTLEQIHEIEELLNPELSSNASNAHPLNDYYPSFDQNANQPQQGNQNNLNNSELNGLNPHENSPAGNQGWDEEFIDSLFQNDPFCESGNPGKI